MIGAFVSTQFRVGEVIILPSNFSMNEHKAARKTSVLQQKCTESTSFYGPLSIVHPTGPNGHRSAMGLSEKTFTVELPFLSCENGCYNTESWLVDVPN
jgi:hypothetical protein